MNPVFWILVIAGVVLLWFLMSFAFKWIGSIAFDIWDEAKKEITDENND